MRAPSVLSLLAILALTASPGPARAGGFEYPAAGTRALGRGGAFHARADDPMALLYDPAALVSLSPNQLMLNAHLGFLGACYDREGTYQIGDPAGASTDYATSFDADPEFPGEWAAAMPPYPEVCNDGPPAPSPNVAFTMRPTPDLGIGFGIVAPAAIGHTVWGDPDDGSVEAAGMRLPSPARYVLVEEQLILVYPTLGVGYRPVPWMQIGASFQWGLGLFEFTNYARPYMGEDVSTDIRSDLSARDLFIPAAIASVHLIPHDNVDIALFFRWSDDVKASADVELLTGAYGIGREGQMVQSYVPTRNEYDDATLTSPQGWQMGIGLRYADRITPRPRDTAEVERLSGRVEDPMSNERWDVELDVVYELNRRVDDVVIQMPEGSTADFRKFTSTGDPGVDENYPIPEEFRIPHQWSDQLSLRLGGDYNVVPGMAAVRLGFSFETRGVNEKYAGLDFFPMQRYGVHGGLTVRLGRFDISLAYAHIFQETVEVSMDDAGLHQISATDGGAVVNAGTYESNIDVVSLGINWHL